MENQFINLSPSPQKSKPNFVIWIVAGVITLAIGISVGLAVGKYSPKAQISSYDDCIKAKGSRIQESYPASCVTAAGQRFIQPLTDEEKQILQPPDVNSEPTASSPILMNRLTYQKKMFDLDSSYNKDLAYPSEVRELSESGLQDVACNSQTNLFDYKTSDQTWQEEHPRVKSQKGSRSDPLTISEQVSLIKQGQKIAGTAQVRVERYEFCYLKDGSILFLFGATPKQGVPASFLDKIIRPVQAGGGWGSDFYVFYLGENNQLEQVAYLPMQKTEYWGCAGGVYGLTISDKLYLQCTGGEAKFSPGEEAVGMYKIDINDKTYVEIMRCIHDKQQDKLVCSHDAPQG